MLHELYWLSIMALATWSVHKDCIVTLCFMYENRRICCFLRLMVGKYGLWVNSVRPDGVWLTEEFCLQRTEDRGQFSVYCSSPAGCCCSCCHVRSRGPSPPPPPARPSQPLSAPITVHMATTSHGGWLTCTSLCACLGGVWLILAPGETKFDLKD